MKILLINPSFESGSGRSVSYGEPLGLLYIAAAIERTLRHQVEIIDCVADVTLHRKIGNGCTRYGMSAETLCGMLAGKQFDVAGITCTNMTDESTCLQRFIAIVKAFIPEVPFIGGGPEATLEYKRYCRSGLLDYIIVGEGEAAIVELLDALENGSPLAAVHSLVYRGEDGVLRRNPEAPPCDIGALPRPARHLIPFTDYLRHRANAYYFRSPAAAILTSRACPYECRFCNVQVIWGRRWRARSAPDVVDEMEELIRDYGIREFLIQDDNFMVDGTRVEAICDEMIRRGLKVSWHVQAGMHVAHLNRGIIDKLIASGLYSFCVQLETCSLKTLRYINKRVDLQHARELLTYANRRGLFTQSNIIIGFHFETKEDIDESIAVAESLGIDQINYILAIPKPHTSMYRDWLREGLIDGSSPVRMPMATTHFSGAELLALCTRANRRHYMIRFRQLFGSRRFFTELLPKVASPGRLRYVCRRLFQEIVS